MGDLLGMGSSSNSYFPAPAAPVREQFKVVNPTPAGPSSSMRSLNPALPADPSFVSLNMADDISATGTRYQDLELGPAVAPYPPEAGMGHIPGEQKRIQEQVWVHLSGALSFVGSILPWPLWWRVRLSHVSKDYPCFSTKPLSRITHLCK